MNLKLLLFLLLFSISSSAFSQQTSIDTWDRILKTANVEWNELYKTCPNFPKGNMEKEVFTKAINNWSNSFPEEVISFYAIKKIEKINPSPHYLGLPLEEGVQDYKNSFIQWIKESNISDRKLMSIAPNMPLISKEMENLDFEFERWKTLYGHEFEKLVNSEELVSLNPYYKEYNMTNKMPSFIGTLDSVEKPSITADTDKEKLTQELRLMNWYFVFENTSFRKTYGFNPEFPEFFNVEKYKRSIVEKIKETARQISLGNTESN